MARAEQEASAQTEAIRERFTRRISELAPDAPGLDERVFLEAAALATKADVREELDRLTAHVDSARTLLQQPPAGRKLDFLMQEFMREANTLCSKSATTRAYRNRPRTEGRHRAASRAGSECRITAPPAVASC